MRKIFWALLFSLLFCVFTFSQEAVKVDEVENVQCDDYLARMDSPINLLRSEPSSTIYILVYEGMELIYNPRKQGIELVFPAFGSAKVKIRSIKKLLKIRRAPIEKFKFVEAGFREKFTLEFWVVPAKATPPTPIPTLTKMRYRKGKATGLCLGCCEP